MVFLYLISKGCENTEKSLEQLKQEYEKTTVLLEQEKRKMQRLKNRQAYLESGSRKQRTHRLITRGAAIESIAPQTKEMCIRDRGISSYNGGTAERKEGYPEC